MAREYERVPIVGSERAALSGSRVIGAANPNQVIQVTVRLRTHTPLSGAELQQEGALLPGERQYVTPDDYEHRFGANPQDVSKIENFAQTHQLTVVEADRASRSVILSGTVSAFSRAFDVELSECEYEGVRYRGRVGALYIPHELAGIVTGVFGLDDRPQTTADFAAAPRQPAAS